MAETTKEELEAVKKDLAELRKDLKGLAHAVKESGYEKVDRARHRAEDTYRSAVRQGEETLERGREEIREHPFTTVLGALLVGFGIGVLLERK
jgi:ElaB/YqjD/DUF883 family membrane-anchored ribosome-binding protein